MKKKQLGQSDLVVSEIGLGCMSLGTNERNAMNIVAKAIELGINFLDTADLYDNGLNEEIVGKAIKGRRDEVILATKVGNRREPGKPGWFWDPSKRYIKEAVKESLKRLGTDYIDLYQLHGGTIDDPIDETIEAFEELKQDGWIRWYGISSIRPNVIKEYMNRSHIISVMMQYSIMDRRPEEEVLDLLHENNISVIARGPLSKGLLTERFEEKAEKLGDAEYLGYSKGDALQLGHHLQRLAVDDRSMNGIALRYSLHHPAVTTVIPGASSVSQLLENIEAMSTSYLTSEEYQFIQSISKQAKYEAHR